MLSALDGYPLAARLFDAPDGVAPSSVALINAGAGIAFQYYERFAEYFAGSGIPTLIYDYRGIARSRPKVLRGFSASIEDWGSKDCAACLVWLSTQFPSVPRIVIGHSVGGFLTGFSGGGPGFEKFILVGAHNGYWRDYAPRRRLAMYGLWHLAMPAITSVVGFFPGRALHLSEDLPAGVAIEWASRRRPEFWWNVRKPDGGPDLERIDNALAKFRAIKARTLAISFTDDPFATAAATDRLLGLYENCEATRYLISPKDANGQSIGHFGFFRSRFRETLWERVLSWAHL